MKTSERINLVVGRALAVLRGDVTRLDLEVLALDQQQKATVQVIAGLEERQQATSEVVAGLADSVRTLGLRLVELERVGKATLRLVTQDDQPTEHRAGTVTDRVIVDGRAYYVQRPTDGGDGPMTIEAG